MNIDTDLTSGYWVVSRPPIVGKSSDIIPRTEFLAPSSARYGEHSPECPVCGSAVGLLPWLPPYDLELLHYTKEDFEDIVFGFGGGDFLVSERLLTFWTNALFTGLEEVLPVRLSSIKSCPRGRTPPNYYTVLLKHDLSQFDAERSRVKRTRVCTCRLCEGYDLDSIGPVVFKEETLTGQDLFRCINGSIIAMTPRAGTALLKAGFVLSSLVPANAYRRNSAV